MYAVKVIIGLATHTCEIDLVTKTFDFAETPRAARESKNRGQGSGNRYTNLKEGPGFDRFGYHPRTKLSHNYPKQLRIEKPATVDLCNGEAVCAPDSAQISTIVDTFSEC